MVLISAFGRGCVETYLLATAQVRHDAVWADQGLSRDRFQQRMDAEDGDYPRRIVGEKVRLISIRTRFSPRVRRRVAPRLDGFERMFDRLPADAHRFWRRV